MCAEARGQQQVPSSISLHLVFGGRVSLNLELTDGAGLAAKCVVFWHIDGSASPELHFAGGFYRSAGDPNLGPYARMQTL